jgi:hypothetical protein
VLGASYSLIIAFTQSSALSTYYFGGQVLIFSVLHGLSVVGRSG